MPDLSVSRRVAIGTLAGGGATALLVASMDSPVSTGSPDEGGALAAPAETVRERHLLSPLAQGSRLLSWEVEAIEPLAMGAVRVRLHGENGVAFGVEVLAREASPIAARPPAETARFALYVNNGGDGRMPTVEDQGLAAMALAQIVARNEAHVSTEGFLTHGERIAEHPVALLRHVDGAGLPGPFDPATALDVQQVHLSPQRA
jgi:hypothetical protein